MEALALITRTAQDIERITAAQSVNFAMTVEVQKEGDSGQETEPAPAAGTKAATSQPQKVLIVEDAIELAEVIAATLERINIQTFHETHVERAFEAFIAVRPDMILLDISLPDKTGWKLLDEIKAQPDVEQPIVIVITAHGDPANRLMGKLQGVYSYLVKPFTPDEVEALVGRAFRGAAPQQSAGDVMTTDNDGVDTQHTPGSDPDMLR